MISQFDNGASPQPTGEQRYVLNLPAEDASNHWATFVVNNVILAWKRTTGAIRTCLGRQQKDQDGRVAEQEGQKNVMVLRVVEEDDDHASGQRRFKILGTDSVVEATGREDARSEKQGLDQEECFHTASDEEDRATKDDSKESEGYPSHVSTPTIDDEGEAQSKDMQGQSDKASKDSSDTNRSASA